MPKVSILAAAFNHEKYIAKAIESVLAQTYGDWELIIWDDGSKDATLRIAQDFAEKHDDKIKVFTHPNKENRGQEVTRNEAMAKASGELIGILDTDDFYHPEKLEKLVPLFDDAHVGLAYGSANFYLDTLDEIVSSEIANQPSGDVFDELVYDNFICAGATLFRKNFFKQGLKFDSRFKTIGEYPLWLAIAFEARVRHSDAIVCYWRSHSHNLGKSLALEAKKELVDFKTSLLSEKKYAQKKSAILRALNKSRYDYASELYSQQKFDEAKPIFLELANAKEADGEIRKKSKILSLLILAGPWLNRLFVHAKKKMWTLQRKGFVSK